MFVDVDGLRLHYYASGPGDGLPVVLIHGWAGSGRACASTMLQALREHRCFALDVPGQGMSDNSPEDWYSVVGYGHVLVPFCQRDGAKSPATIGHPMGVTIAEVPLTDGAEAVRFLPRAELLRLPCGHHPADEAPLAHRGTLRTFLRQAA